MVDEGNLSLARGVPRPAGTRVVLRPNKYDPGGPTWPSQLGEAAGGGGDAGDFLEAGSRTACWTRDVFGPPVVSARPTAVRPARRWPGSSPHSSCSRAMGRGRAMNRREMFTAVGALPLASLAGREVA